MINEEYVNAETFKLLKEAGFPMTTCVEPTQARAMRWLREEHEWPLDIVSVPNKMTVDKNGTGHPSDYEYVVIHTTLPHFRSYEAAAEAGIQNACKYLIEKGGRK